MTRRERFIVAPALVLVIATIVTDLLARCWLPEADGGGHALFAIVSCVVSRNSLARVLPLVVAAGAIGIVVVAIWARDWWTINLLKRELERIRFLKRRSRP